MVNELLPGKIFILYFLAQQCRGFSEFLYKTLCLGLYPDFSPKVFEYAVYQVAPNCDSQTSWSMDAIYVHRSNFRAFRKGAEGGS